MRCLAVNTANTVLSVALVEDDKVIYRFATAETRDQGNVLLDQADAALKQAGYGYDGLDMLAVVTGPGSFTGIRIGIAAMRGMALAAGKPLAGVSSFDLFAEPQDGMTNVVAVESWREELYLQATGQDAVNEKPEIFAARVTGKVLISGDAAAKLAPHIAGAVVSSRPLADAADAAKIAMARGVAAAESPVPYYLRPADVTLAGGLRRLES